MINILEGHQQQTGNSPISDTDVSIEEVKTEQNAYP
jgi:hypothetical protein